MQITEHDGDMDAVSSASAAGEGVAAPAREQASFIDTFDVDASLTSNDKLLVGWDPTSDQLNQAAIAIAGYRHLGMMSGEIDQDFVASIRKRIKNTGGYPADPTTLVG